MNQQFTLPQFLENQATRLPHAKAFWVRNNRNWSSISWQTFFNKVQALSYGLIKEGFGKGDVIAIMANTSLEWELFNQAILAIGGTVVGLDPNELSEHLTSMVDSSEVKVLVVDKIERLNKFNSQTCQRFNKVITFDTNESEMKLPNFIHLNKLISHKKISIKLPDISPDDIATIVFTSGTTGTPKGIVYRHQQIIFAVHSILRTYPELGVRCNLACWLPLSNLFQRIINFSAIASGAQTYVVDNPKQIMEYLPQINPHIFVAVPRFYEKLYQGLESKLNKSPVLVRKLLKFTLLKAENKSINGLICKRFNYFLFKSFRSLFGHHICYMVSGSAPMPVWLLRRYKAMGLLVLEAYGQTENVIPIAANRLDQYQFGSVGKVLPGNEIKLAEDNELLIKGMGVCSGYLGSKYESVLDSKGYLGTGDFADIDSNGYIRLTGRKSEVFKTSTGRKIAPVLIEAKIQQVEQVEHSVICGQNKKYLIALVSVNYLGLELHQNLTKDALQFSQHVQSYINDLPHYQQPVGIILLYKSFSVADQELTSNLKLRRKNIQQRYANIIAGLYNELDNPQSEIHIRPIKLDKSTILLKL